MAVFPESRTHSSQHPARASTTTGAYGMVSWTPLASPGLFAVIDRIGDGANLEEYWLDRPVIIEA